MQVLKRIISLILLFSLNSQAFALSVVDARLRYFIATRNVDKVKSCIDAGAQLNDQSNTDRNTPLHDAICRFIEEAKNTEKRLNSTASSMGKGLLKIGGAVLLTTSGALLGTVSGAGILQNGTVERTKNWFAATFPILGINQQNVPIDQPEQNPHEQPALAQPAIDEDGYSDDEEGAPANDEVDLLGSELERGKPGKEEDTSNNNNQVPTKYCTEKQVKATLGSIYKNIDPKDPNMNRYKKAFKRIINSKEEVNLGVKAKVGIEVLNYSHEQVEGLLDKTKEKLDEVIEGKAKETLTEVLDDQRDKLSDDFQKPIKNTNKAIKDIGRTVKKIGRLTDQVRRDETVILENMTGLNNNLTEITDITKKLLLGSLFIAGLAGIYFGLKHGAQGVYNLFNSPASYFNRLSTLNANKTIIRMIVEHPAINLSLVDKNGQTALDLIEKTMRECSFANDKETYFALQEIAELIKVRGLVIA